MARQPKRPRLEHVKYVTSKGKTYAYFNTGAFSPKGKAIYARMPDPSDIGFFDSYAALKAGRTKRATVKYLVADLVRDFDEATERRTDIKEKTKQLYRISNKHVTRTLGEFPVDKVEAADIRYMLDNAIDGAGTKSMFVKMMRLLYNWARDEKKTTIDPAKGVKSAKLGEHQPWPEKILEAGLASQDKRLQLSINLLYFTGQRIGDVLKMRWDDIDGGEIYVLQEKTGKEVWPPIHRRLAAVLAGTVRTGETILANDEGAPLSDERVRDDIKAFSAGMGRHCVPHGLRKNAVNALLESGCTIAEVASITGQSFQLVEHYARKVNNRKLGRIAMSKLENKDGSGKPETKPSEKS